MTVSAPRIIKNCSNQASANNRIASRLLAVFLSARTRFTAIILLLSFGVRALGTANDPQGANDGENSPSSRTSGRPINFLADDSLPNDKFAVFIGINKYAGIPDRQLDGCVPDALSMMHFFTSPVYFNIRRFALLTDEDATRANIGEVLTQLVEQVEKARAKLPADTPISVVITYAGHGSRVKRISQGKDDNPDDPDESTWVASDAVESDTESGHNDVRASELFKVHGRLSELGAQVVFICDACYSGKGYRSVAKIRSIDRPKDRLPVGPAADLLPKLRPGPNASASPEARAQSLPGFVWFAACGGTQVAGEGNGHGYFTRALIELLPQITPSTTYAELASRISAWCSVNYTFQTPEFHAPMGKMNERFLIGGFAPPHATIIQLDNDKRIAKLNMGKIFGISPATRFIFYKDSADFDKDKDRLVVTNVSKVGDLDCQVDLPPNSPKIDVTAWARPDYFRMDDVIIGVDGTMPQPVLDKLQTLSVNKQIALASGSQKYDVALHFNPMTSEVGIYDAISLPRDIDKRPDGTDPAPLRDPVRYYSPNDAEKVAASLLYALRVRLLMNLHHVDQQGLKSEIVVLGKQAMLVGGIARLEPNDTFSIRLTNSAPIGLFITLFTVDASGNLTLLFPGSFDTPELLQPGRTLDLPPKSSPLRADIDHPERLRGSAGERTSIKIIASNQQIDFGVLLVAPETGAHNVRSASQTGRGQVDPLFDLIRDTLHGGPLARETIRPPRTEISFWTTDELALEVAPTQSQRK